MYVCAHLVGASIGNVMCKYAPRFNIDTSDYTALDCLSSVCLCVICNGSTDDVQVFSNHCISHNASLCVNPLIQLCLNVSSNMI